MRARLFVLQVITLVLVAVSANATSTLFTPTGSLNLGRVVQRATLLTNGKVLLSGGISQFPAQIVFTASSEIYDPATHTFTPTGSLLKARSQHSATLLPNGKVLIAGGYNETAPLAPEGSRLTSSELYDPATGTFSSTGSLHYGRYNHEGVVVPGGKVLVFGGTMECGCEPAEIYDPTTGTFTETTPPPSGVATFLFNGKLLVTNYHGAFLYDPLTGATTQTAHDMVVRRSEHSSTLLPNGKVLLTGGYVMPTGWADAYAVASAELYDPVTDSFTSTGSLAGPRIGHDGVPLGDGHVLVLGGVSGPHSPSPIVNEVELYDVAQGTFTTIGPMFADFSPSTITPLPDGTVLFAGGLGPRPKLECCSAQAMLYQPSQTEPVVSTALVPTMSEWALALLATALVAIAVWRRQAV